MKKVAIILTFLLNMISVDLFAKTYQLSAFDRDFMACSSMARKKSVDKSDAMYLGYFYGCMMSYGHDTSQL